MPHLRAGRLEGECGALRSARRIIHGHGRGVNPSRAVEETLRFDAPVQIILRRTQLDVELGGVLIPKGGMVAAILGSANRDERHHPDPDAFRLDRPEPHLAFGAGPHFCLGSSLARLEATIGLSILLEETRHFQALESVAEIPRIPSLQLRGPERLLITVA